MGEEKTLTNYVKNNLDDLYWNAIEKFLESTDYDLLNLKLNQIEVISKIEINYLNVKSVHVSNRPQDSIKFDILVEADLEVYDKYFYRNDVTESIRQWFCVECIGRLGAYLKDSEYTKVSVYDGKLHDNTAMSQRLVPIMNKEDCENYASMFIQKYYPEASDSREWLDPNELAKRMGLTVTEKVITKEHSVFGQIFFEDSNGQFYDLNNDCCYTEKIQSGTIVLDPDIAFFRNLGAKFNTIVHECVHWDLHKKAFQLEKLFDSKITKFSCLAEGGILENNSDAVKWIEWQANTIAPMIQMPKEAFRIKVEEAILKFKKTYNLYDSLDWIEPVIDEVSNCFMVSRLAAKIRMIELGYEEAIGAFVYVDGKYVPTHTVSKNFKLERNKTFSVSYYDLALEILINEELRNKIYSGMYTYVNSHVILNLPKYVSKDIFGFEKLTDYARRHMEECCLPFDIKVKSGVSTSSYQAISILNRDKDSPIEFEVRFVNGYENVPTDKQIKAFGDIIKVESELYLSMSNDYIASLREIMKRKNINQKQLAEKIGVNAETVGRCLSGKTINRNTLMLICLGLHLPYKCSLKLLESAGCPLVLSDRDHQYYDFVLKMYYHKELVEIQKFLSDHGVENL